MKLYLCEINSEDCLSDDITSRRRLSRLQHALAWEILREALRREGISEPEFEKTETGRPYLVSYAGLPVSEKIDFNISHCLAAVAVLVSVFSPEEREKLSDEALPGRLSIYTQPVPGTVGVDAERRFPCTSALLRHAASTQEREFLESLPQAERDSWFGRIWSRKESYLKRTGEGLRRNLSNLTVLTQREMESAVSSRYPSDYISMQHSLSYHIQTEAGVFWELQDIRKTICTCADHVPDQIIHLHSDQIFSSSVK